MQTELRSPEASLFFAFLQLRAFQKDPSVNPSSMVLRWSARSATNASLFEGSFDEKVQKPLLTDPLFLNIAPCATWGEHKTMVFIQAAMAVNGCIRLATKEVWRSTSSHMFLFASPESPLKLLKVITRLEKREDGDFKWVRNVMDNSNLLCNWLRTEGDGEIWPENEGVFILFSWDHSFHMNCLGLISEVFRTAGLPTKGLEPQNTEVLEELYR